MSTGYLLLDRPQARKQYGIPRRGNTRPSGTMVVHTAENAPDLDGPDSGAENVAAWLLRRTDAGSYHSLVDSDSIVLLAPTHAETWHETSTNRWAVGISAAVRAAGWADIPTERRHAIVRNLALAAAQHARVLRDQYGVTVPAVRITRAQALARVPGFIGHGEIDTGRRSDPGASFDWTLFLSAYAEAMALPAPPPGPAPSPAAPASGLLEDGKWGAATTRDLQGVFGTTVDGVVSHQWRSRHNESLYAAHFDRTRTGSQLILAMQVWLKNKGRYAGALDGLAGPLFIAALQTEMGTTVDSVISPVSDAVREMQRRLNAGTLR